jgi:hypothetical protein
MNPEDRKLLLKSIEMAEDNNRLLKKIWRVHRWGRAFKLIYWVIIIGIAVGAFYFLDPYIKAIKSQYDTIRGDIGDLRDIKKSFSR